MRPSVDSRSVVLFDIDGTLLIAGGAGRRAFLRTFEHWVGEPLDLDFELGGRTDLEIFRGLIRHLDLPYPTPPERRDLVRTYLELLDEELRRPDMIELCAGIESLLRSLEEDPAWDIGLVTGNLEAGAWLKLSAAGLDRFFAFGAFGSDRENRNDLVPVALSRWRRRLGHRPPPGRCWVIGDTRKDIECARAAGVRVLAVGTGFEDRGNLLAGSPDAFMEDLADTNAALEVLRRD